MRSIFARLVSLAVVTTKASVVVASLTHIELRRYLHEAPYVTYPLVSALYVMVAKL